MSILVLAACAARGGNIHHNCCATKHSKVFSFVTLNHMCSAEEPRLRGCHSLPKHKADAQGHVVVFLVLSHLHLKHEPSGF